MRSLSFRVEDVPSISGPGPEPGRLPPARGAVRPGPGRGLQGDHRSSRHPHPGASHAARRGRPGPLRARRRAPADLRRLDTQLRESKKKLALVVRASGTTLTGIFGVGPVIAATVIGDVGDVSRFPSRDRFAAYNGTAPVEVSSGDRKIYRLSRRGNRRLNHAIHMAAVTQIRQRTATAAPTTTRRSLRARLTKRRSATSPATTGNPWSPTARSSSARCCLSTRPAARFNRRLRSAARAAGWPPAWGPPVRARWRSGLACRRC